MSAVVEIERGIASGRLLSIVDGKFSNGQPVHPIILSVVDK